MDSLGGCNGVSARNVRSSTGFVHASCLLLLGIFVSGAQAAPVYKCVDAHGAIAYQDVPCATQVRQSEIDAAGQPLIDPNAPVTDAASVKPSAAHARNGKMNSAWTRAAKAKAPVSWECRAASGEVFYRHTHCPGSVPGDGVVRNGHAQTPSRSRSRKRHDAWSQVPVHGTKVPRAEACRRIHAPSAAGRDGHQRDDTVSAYDHMLGRDPCDGA